MNAILPKSWERLPKSEKDKIAEVLAYELDRRVNIIFDIYMKMSCSVLHDAFGFGENRLMCYLGNYQRVFMRHIELVKNGTQIETLDKEMRAIFKKTGYPDEFFKNLVGQGWDINTNGGDKE